MPTDSTSEPSTKVLLGCSRCGANLPDEARFCLQCGKPVGVPAKQAAAKSLPAAKSPEVAAQAPGRHSVDFAWHLAAPAGVDGDQRQPFRAADPGDGRMKHDETIIETETPFLVGAHTFRYYKFALPEGSLNVAVVGQFSATSGGDKTQKQGCERRQQDRGLRAQRAGIHRLAKRIRDQFGV